MNAASDPSSATSGSRVRGVRGGPAFFAFVGIFMAVLAYFGFVDPYRNHFFQSGYSALYNTARIILAAYLFWLFSFVGSKTLTGIVGERPLLGIKLHERLALGFFVGGAVITVVMLFLGYVYLYWRALAAVIAIALVAVSYRDFAAVCREASSSIALLIRDNSRLDLISAAMMLVAVIFFGGVLLLVKGLYPQGGHDYYQHYSQFYSLVVDNHNVWPNDFWYHYYYSKGLGVMFLGMLLSDALAPSLVTFCFVAAAAVALYSLVGRFCPRTLWPWAAVVLYLALNVHTLGTGFYAANGGWGHFQKPHEINAPLLIAILWMSVGMVRSEGEGRRPWWLGAAACSFVVAYFLIISSAIVGLFTLLATVGFFFRRRDSAIAFFGLAVAAGLGLVSVFMLNYLTTGMPSDIAINAWWPIIDFRRLDEAGTLFDVTNTAFRRAEAVARGVSFRDFDLLDFVRNAGRFDILGSLMWGAVIGAALWVAASLTLRSRLARFALPIGSANVAAGTVVLAYLAAVALFTLAVGASEPISYVRTSSFALPLMVAVAAIVWQLATVSVDWPRWGRGLLGYVVPVALAGLTLAQAYEGQKLTLLPVLANAVRFVDGRYSIYDGYRDQTGWPALPNSTAIYPGMYEAWKSIGPGQRLWSFNVHSYCMIPGCRVESHLSSKMSARRAEILYGSPEVAKQVLQSEGLNYFFIATRLDIRDPLICTPLFAPDTISEYMGVKWTDGTDALLTWKGPGVAPLSAEWVGKYRATLKGSPHTPDCTGNGPPFSYIGLRVHDDVVGGKRWGREIEPPK
jgi:hypothetical protein